MGSDSQLPPCWVTFGQVLPPDASAPVWAFLCSHGSSLFWRPSLTSLAAAPPRLCLQALLVPMFLLFTLCRPLIKLFSVSCLDEPCASCGNPGWSEMLAISGGGARSISSLQPGPPPLRLLNSNSISPWPSFSSGSATKPVLSFSVHMTALCSHPSHGTHPAVWYLLSLLSCLPPNLYMAQAEAWGECGERGQQTPFPSGSVPLCVSVPLSVKWGFMYLFYRISSFYEGFIK